MSFEGQILLNKFSACRKFYTVSMASGEKFLTFSNCGRQLAATSKTIDVSIDDKTLAIGSLNGLPKRFEAFLVALDTVETEETFTFDFVRCRLLQ